MLDIVQWSMTRVILMDYEANKQIIGYMNIGRFITDKRK
jgi:hypothetical protein